MFSFFFCMSRVISNSNSFFFLWVEHYKCTKLQVDIPSKWEFWLPLVQKRKLQELLPVFKIFVVSGSWKSNGLIICNVLTDQRLHCGLQQTLPISRSLSAVCIQGTDNLTTILGPETWSLMGVIGGKHGMEWGNLGRGGVEGEIWGRKRVLFLALAILQYCWQHLRLQQQEPEKVRYLLAAGMCHSKHVK